MAILHRKQGLLWLLCDKMLSRETIEEIGERQCWSPAFSPFLTKFYTLRLIFWVTLDLWLANAFTLDIGFFFHILKG